MSTTDTRNVLDNLVQEGKTISAQMTITDSSKALKLMGTMYREDNTFGVTIQTWGNFNVEEALEYKLELVQEEQLRHNERMEYLLDQNNLKDIFLEKYNKGEEL